MAQFTACAPTICDVGVTSGGSPAASRTGGISSMARGNISSAPSCLSWATMLLYIPPGISARFTFSLGAGKPKYCSICWLASSSVSKSSLLAASTAVSKRLSTLAGNVSVSGLNGLGSGFSLPNTESSSSLRMPRSSPLILATASMFTPRSMPSFLQNTYTSSSAGAPVPPPNHQQLVSTMSTPATMAANTDARP